MRRPPRRSSSGPARGPVLAGQLARCARWARPRRPARPAPTGALPVPTTPVPTRARPLGPHDQRRRCRWAAGAGRLDAGDGADGGVAAVEAGDEQEATVVAGGVDGGRASSVSRAMVTTIWGSTTPVVRGRTGRVRAVRSAMGGAPGEDRVGPRDGITELHRNNPSIPPVIPSDSHVTSRPACPAFAARSSGRSAHARTLDSS